MEIRQRPELRTYLLPRLQQSLQILTLPQADLITAIQQELDANPFLEEFRPLSKPQDKNLRFRSAQAGYHNEESNYRLSLITQKISLQDVLLRQLSMFADDDQTLLIGQEIIGNLDENGYLTTPLDRIALAVNLPLTNVESVLRLIQQFEPAGIGARSISECLLIQQKSLGENEPLVEMIIQFHLEDVARKNYSHIAKSLKQPLDEVELAIKKIVRLDPKPGRNYSQEEPQAVIPDVIITHDAECIKVTINNEDSFSIRINESYRSLLKKHRDDKEAKEFLSDKLRYALELVQAVSKRKETLLKIMQVLVDIQQEALLNDFSSLKPLTFKEVAKRLSLHETTVCRAVMNKYVELPEGSVIALKNFFTSRINGKDGESFSSGQIKSIIKECIEQEDKKHPLSDQEITRYLLKERKIDVSRRTVAKYREGLKILSSGFRRVK
ncbi:MAG: RNA polymerase sigma-54 factor [Omnitrophica WOR_2 bacterium GWF2_43_52]|nr:MAG: RNA polymerase sigma-54 factor [Omnitrophica WOR_2 bacterium GWC2_44_8]OGX22555.1 MAG: RNA polymerase sigma-54 factor [Omnitrophica WOR_2 bacterium GWF2_43_52]OGX52951.1 MAG: RNA polymerase sigma-54 factor [Omnitrophica WOR_2 bacterium RIFOXYC2_FULL_43_9]HAH21440.1 RNA polymerase sigma-54 factor [Candidatus Omnitrophota bacterium]HBG64644.1 RNA polymerase sigma-54 factor [Candidatus Omnitrophota bacterium]